MKCQHCLKIFGVLAIIRKNIDSSDCLKLCFPCSEIWIRIFFPGKLYNIAYEENEGGIMNKFIGIGRITKDIEIKKTNNGKEYAIFNLAIARPYSIQKETDFIPCQVWNKQAVVLQKYCQKGSQIAITGILQSFKNKDNKIQWIVVQVSNYEFLHTNNDLKKDILLSEKPQEKIEINSSDTKDLFNDNKNIGNDDSILWD